MSGASPLRGDRHVWKMKEGGKLEQFLQIKSYAPSARSVRASTLPPRPPLISASPPQIERRLPPSGRPNCSAELESLNLAVESLNLADPIGGEIDWGHWWMHVGGFKDERLWGNGERAMAGHRKAAVLARLARAWGALRVTLSGVGRVLRTVRFSCGREGAW